MLSESRFVGTSRSIPTLARSMAAIGILHSASASLRMTRNTVTLGVASSSQLSYVAVLDRLDCKWHRFKKHLPAPPHPAAKSTQRNVHHHGTRNSEVVQ